MTKEKIPVER